jgi:hypothetical protein
MKKVLPLIAAIALFLVACGPKGTPTPDAASVQASAVAMAFTMAAQTQAAQPTATEVPPTSTPTIPPPPSPTSFVLPTFPAVLPTSTNVSGDPCNSVMAPNPGGPKVYLMIDNQTKGSLSMSLYLSPTPFSCGFVPLPAIGPNANVGINVPEGCYFPSAYINDPKKQRAIQGPTACIHGNDKITLTVGYEGFKWNFP